MQYLLVRKSPLYDPPEGRVYCYAQWGRSYTIDTFANRGHPERILFSSAADAWQTLISHHRWEPLDHVLDILLPMYSLEEIHT